MSSGEKIEELIMDPEFSLKAIDCISGSIGLCFWMMSDGLSGSVRSAITYGAFTGSIIASSVLMYGYLREDRNSTIEDVLQSFYFTLSLATSWIFFGVATIQCGCNVSPVNPYSVVYGAALVCTVATGIDLVWRRVNK